MHTAEDQLRSVGLRVTKPRLAVLAELAENPHADVEAITAGARERLGKVSTQAVYDVVHALTGVGILRRVEPAGSRALFELDRGDNHHHVVCRSCGAVFDVPCATGSAPCLEASNDHGFRIDEAEVTFWGACSTCVREASSPNDNGTGDSGTDVSDDSTDSTDDN